MGVIDGRYGAATQPPRCAVRLWVRGESAVRGRCGCFCVEGRRGELVAGVFAAALQRLEQIDALFALQLELAQRLDEGALGRRGRAGQRGGAVGIVVGDVLERRPPRTQSFGLVALRFKVDGRRTGKEGLIVGLLSRVGAHQGPLGSAQARMGVGQNMCVVVVVAFGRLDL